MDDVVLEERTFSEVKRLCHAGRPDGLALLGEVIERLRRVVPFEAYCASTKDPATGFITHGMAEETGGDLERSARYVEYLRPLGLAYEMRGAFTSGGYLWGSMDLIREYFIGAIASVLVKSDA